MKLAKFNIFESRRQENKNNYRNMIPKKIVEISKDEIIANVDDIFTYLIEAKNYHIGCGFYGFSGDYFKVDVSNYKEKYDNTKNMTRVLFNYSDLKEYEKRLFDYMNQIGYSFERIRISVNGHGIDHEVISLDTLHSYKYDKYTFLEYIFLTNKNR